MGDAEIKNASLTDPLASAPYAEGDPSAESGPWAESSRGDGSMEVRIQEIEAIYRHAPFAVCILDKDLRYLRINRHMAEINGLPAGEHLGRTCAEVVPDLAESAGRLHRQVLETGEPILNQEMSARRPAPSDVWRTWIAHWLPLKNAQGTTAAVCVIAHEITEQKRDYQALKHQAVQLEARLAERAAQAERRARRLQALAVKLNDAEQQEQVRLAGILHDHLQQLLVAARMRIPQAIGSADPDFQADLQEVDSLLAQSIQATRDLTVDLVPPPLRMGQLCEALAWLGGWFQRFRNLEVAVRVPDHAPAMPQAMAMFLYKSTREMLFNVVKHAGVARAELCMSCEDECILITVADQGRGFDPRIFDDPTQEGCGFGIFHIQERLAALHGRLDVSSAIGVGSRLQLAIPLSALSETRNAVGTTGAADERSR
jgi:PAS domain S-box-containing protein